MSERVVLLKDGGAELVWAESGDGWIEFGWQHPEGKWLGYMPRLPPAALPKLREMLGVDAGELARLRSVNAALLSAAEAIWTEYYRDCDDWQDEPEAVQLRAAIDLAKGGTK